ncbi:MAG: molecular chaperone DnaK, partial [Chloroflexi bacterium]
GIPPAPRGVPQVEVTFDIDANGILHVTAKDKASGKEQKIMVTASTNLNKQDIEKMVQEARAHETEDKKRKEIIEVRNTADNLAYQTEKALKDLGDKVSASEKSSIEGKISELRATAQTEDVEKIKKLTEDLQNAFYALSQQLYAQGQPQPGQPGSGPSTPPPPGGDDVVDGEVKDA